MNIVVDNDGVTQVISSLAPGPDGPSADMTQLWAATNAAAASAAQVAAAESRITAATGKLNSLLLNPSPIDPTVDGGGNSLQTGAIYYNTVRSVLRLYTGPAATQGWTDDAAAATAVLVQLQALSAELTSLATGVKSDLAAATANNQSVAADTLTANDAATAARNSAQYISQHLTDYNSQLNVFSQTIAYTVSAATAATQKLNTVSIDGANALVVANTSQQTAKNALDLVTTVYGQFAVVAQQIAAIGAAVTPAAIYSSVQTYIGQPSGIAGLDANSRVPLVNLPIRTAGLVVAVQNALSGGWDGFASYCRQNGSLGVDPSSRLWVACNLDAFAVFGGVLASAINVYLQDTVANGGQGLSSSAAASQMNSLFASAAQVPN